PGNQKVVGRCGRNLGPIEVVQIGIGGGSVFFESCATYGRVPGASFCPRIAYQNRDCHTLLYVKDILVTSLSCFSVQIEYVDLVERVQQRLAHSPKSNIFKPPPVGDDAHDAVTASLNFQLRKTKELYIVII